MTATYKAMSTSFNGDYFTSGVSEYYSPTSGGEPLGQWFGGAVAALGLNGDVVAKDLRRTLAGNHPQKPKQLVRPCKGKSKPEKSQASGSKPAKAAHSTAKLKQKPRAKRCPAYDVTFSLPKSFSVLWVIAMILSVLGDGRLLREIEAAFDRAVKKTFRWLEQNVELGRRGRAGKHKVKSKLVIAMFDHYVNRSQTWEPHRHRHCVIANMALGPNGVWTAVNSFELRKWIRTLGPLMGVYFAAEIKQRLGLLLERPKDERGRDASWYEVAGIPKSLCKLWSSRHKDLHDLLDGDAIKMDHSTAQARDLAFQLSRQKKQRTPPITELLGQWEKEAEPHGFDSRSVEKLLNKSSPVEFEPAYRQALAASLARITKTEAYFNFRELLQAVCEEIQHLGVDGDKLARQLKHDLKNSPEIVRLTKLGGEMRYTSKKMWEIEERLMKNIERLQSGKGPVVSEKTIEQALRKHPQLDDEQKVAVRHLLSQPSGLRLLTGVAGAGKSAILDCVRDALERSGYKVIAGAISGQAKEELAAKANVQSRTVESYLFHLGKTTREKIKSAVRHHARMLLRALVGKSTWKQTPIKLDSKHVLILDEIGMIDSRSLERLTYYAVKAGCTVLGAGDDKQLQPVLAGGPVHHLINKVGSARLTKNYRQKNDQDVAASQAVRDGKAEAALEDFAKRGRLTIGKDRSDTINRLVDTWVKNGGSRTPQDHFVFVQTRSEARILNARLQAEVLKRRKTPRLANLRVGSQRIYRGDRIMFRVPYRAQGIENGYRGTVLSINPMLGRLTIRLDRQPRQQPGQRAHKQVVTVSLKALQKAVREPGRDPISIAFAGTTHALQGAGVKTAYCLLGGQMTDRQMAYTQLTRGIQQTHVFCDALHAGEDLKDFARSMNKSREKRMAHDLVRPKPTQTKDRPTLEITLER